jgi:branched-chain amino acid transport system ATP-binding protein
VSAAAIDVQGLVKRFGGLVALDGVTFEAARGEVLGIIGVNGAGKTTLMNCICGIYRPDAGAICLDGTAVTGMEPHDIAQRGVGRTFQVPRVFRRMRLVDLRHNYAEELSGGQQKLLEMARMLMPDPRVVMLDEPFAGVHPTLCRFMIEQIEAMAAAGKTVLLISHDLTSIYRLSSRVVALNQGRVIAQGGVDAIRGNHDVIEAYLGS